MKSNGYKKLSFSAVAFMLATFVAIIFQRLSRPLTVAPDCCELLECAQIWVDGKTPYVDFIELNPPLVIALYTVPVKLSRLLEIHLLPIFLICSWLLTMISILLCYGLLKNSSVSRKLSGVTLFAVCVASLALCRQDYFGQREQLFVMSFLPFLLMRWLITQGTSYPRAARIVIALVAALGCCIKPHFLLIPVVLEYYFWHTAKNYTFRTSELAAFAAIVAVYACQFALWSEPPRRQFFEFIMPLSCAAYSDYNAPLSQVLLLDHLPKYEKWLLIPLACLTALACRRQNTLIAPLLVVCTTGYTIMVLQQKAFPYHCCPTLAATYMLIVIEFSLLLQNAKSKLANQPRKEFIEKAQSTLAISMSIALAFFSVTKFCLTAFNTQSYETVLREPIASLILKHTATADKILFFDTGGGLQFPLSTQLERRVGSRYVELFPFAMTYFLNARANNQTQLNYAQSAQTKILTEFTFDVQTNKPQLLFIPDYSWPMPRSFSIFQYLCATDYWLKLTKLYKPLGEVEGYHVFKLRQSRSAIH